VDYDYSKAYGGGGDTSVVSSVGGTLGSQTQAGPGGAGVVDASFSDDASFDAHYQDPNASVKEIALEVWAPPGKLGVVIDTPNDGAPVVHAIKDSSPIADKLQVGDKLVAVDDENVETMTAIKVSKLISRKSANSTRKLSIVRTVAGGDGM
jgi:C-terminal processing protease CtpA/Prc